MFQPFTKTFLDDDAIKSIRHELYHSQGLGFHVFRNFLSAHEIQHMRHVWSDYDWTLTHTKFLGKSNQTLQAPDQFDHDEARNTQSYWNYYWNKSKRCGYTQETCSSIQVLKNLISGKSPFDEFAVTKIAGHNYVAAYRVVNTFSVKNFTGEHMDWGPRENPLDKRHQPGRLQCTLFLSSYGEDYMGEGFYLTNKRGIKSYFGRDVGVKAGDLVIWPYNSPHGVGEIIAEDPKIGFLRIVFPSESLDTSRAYSSHTREIVSLVK